MDRRQFFGACAALVAGTAFERRLLPYEAPTVRYIGTLRGHHADTLVFDDPFQRLNTVLPTYEGLARVSIYDL